MKKIHHQAYLQRALLQVFQRQSPVFFQLAQSVGFDAGVGIAELSDQDVEKDDQDEKEKDAVDKDPQPPGKRKDRSNILVLNTGDVQSKA